MDLGRLPGVNGDEAWYGVQMLLLRAGDSVDWRTPSGNMMGPLQAGLLFVLQLFREPSFALLRLPAVLAGVLQVALMWLVFRRHFDAPAAWLAATITAVLPVNIAYSRFGWDPSHAGLVAVIALHAALLGNVLLTAAAFAFSLWAYPTNVFLAPFLFLAFLGAGLSRWGTRRTAMRAIVLGMLLCGGLGVIRLTASGGRTHLEAREVLDRATSPEQWSNFAVLLGRFVTGDVTHEYVAGTWMGPLPAARDVALGGALAMLLAVTAWRLRRDGLSARTGVIAGALVAVTLFGVLAGAKALVPHLERYGLTLLVPCVAALALMLRQLGGSARASPSPEPTSQRPPAPAPWPVAARAWPGYAVVCVCGVVLLAHFHRDYLEALRRTGSASHRTFWTGEREPKELALQTILEDSPQPSPLRIVAEDWWTFWPIRYLAHGEKRVEVAMFDGSSVEADGRALFLVGFPGGALERWLDSPASPGSVTSVEIPGYARPVALLVWKPAGLGPRGSLEPGAPGSFRRRAVGLNEGWRERGPSCPTCGTILPSRPTCDSILSDLRCSGVSCPVATDARHRPVPGPSGERTILDG